MLLFFLHLSCNVRMVFLTASWHMLARWTVLMMVKGSGCCVQIMEMNAALATFMGDLEPAQLDYAYS